MNATELATRMLEWETTQRAADALRKEIEAAVLERGKTQTVGNVRATFSAGRKTYDYETPITSLENWQVRCEGFMQVSWDYKAACAAFGIDAPVKSQSEPSVSLKLLV